MPRAPGLVLFDRHDDTDERLLLPDQRPRSAIPPNQQLERAAAAGDGAAERRAGGIGAVPGRTIRNVRQRAGRGWRQRGERLRTPASAAACVAPERRVISCLKRLS